VSPDEPVGAGEQVGASGALRALAKRAAAEGEPLASAAARELPEPVLGLLVAEGSRTAENPSAYAFVVEAVREGYGCHYGRPRVLETEDTDLLLLAGDLFYAYGISTLADLGDDQSVALLSDLIRVSGELHAAGRADDVDELWLARIMALANGSDGELEQLTEALRQGSPGAAEGLRGWTDRVASESSGGERIGEVRDVLHFGSAGLEFP
jgi:hypothetical protein